jgi:ketopantoate reductase
VGSNAVSAFYSWRLASSRACELTVVWRRNWQAVQDYGIVFHSAYFGSENWKPLQGTPCPIPANPVVHQVEDAVDPSRPYDYILVCVKVIPELYELADVIADVVTPSHTCILLNTTTTIGVEKSLGARFPKNLILSLVNFAELNQTGACEFEHVGDSAKVWIGSALLNDTIPEETQQDMAESLALTLEAGAVDCHVSHNILQQQWEKMMGYPLLKLL